MASDDDTGNSNNNGNNNSNGNGNNNNNVNNNGNNNGDGKSGGGSKKPHVNGPRRSLHLTLLLSIVLAIFAYYMYSQLAPLTGEIALYQKKASSTAAPLNDQVSNLATLAASLQNLETNDITDYQSTLTGLSSAITAFKLKPAQPVLPAQPLDTVKGDMSISGIVTCNFLSLSSAGIHFNGIARGVDQVGTNGSQYVYRNVSFNAPITSVTYMILCQAQQPSAAQYTDSFVVKVYNQTEAGFSYCLWRCDQAAGWADPVEMSWCVFW